MSLRKGLGNWRETMNKDIKQIIERIKSNDPTLINIDLSKNRLEHNQVMELAIALQSNNHVESINIFGSRAYEDGAKELAKTKLKKLNIGYNQIGDEGAIAFVTNSTIEELDISSNHISDVGAIGISYNETIRKLNISGNMIQTNGAKCLSRMNLESIECCGNEFPSSTVEPKVVENLTKKQRTK